MILHGKEDDLGIARGRFLEGRIKLGDTIPVSTRLCITHLKESLSILPSKYFREQISNVPAAAANVAEI